MSELGTALLIVIQNAPAEIAAFKSIYGAVKGYLTPHDITTVDQALAEAIAADKASTEAADISADAASKR